MEKTSTVAEGLAELTSAMVEVLVGLTSTMVEELAEAHLMGNSSDRRRGSVPIANRREVPQIKLVKYWTDWRLSGIDFRCGGRVSGTDFRRDGRVRRRHAGGSSREGKLQEFSKHPSEGISGSSVHRCG